MSAIAKLTGLDVANRHQRPILVGNVGWMARYQGLVRQPDKIVGGGAYVAEHHRGGECCNFLTTDDGLVYGHFETIHGKTDRSVDLVRLGAPSDAEKLQHVDVVWVATCPKEHGRRVVGYYLDATVYRSRQRHSRYPSSQHRADKIGTYIVTAQVNNATLIPLKQRTVELGRGPGWIGEANWWFPETSDGQGVHAFLRRVRALLATEPEASARAKIAGRKWGGPTDPGHNALVEAAALECVRDHFSRFEIKSVEKDNRGWDLEMYVDATAHRKGHAELIVEVKGLSSTELQVGVTPNEFDAITHHLRGSLPRYRLCVVADALAATPVLHVFRYSGATNGWVDDESGSSVSLNIKKKTAAIISIGQ